MSSLFPALLIYYTSIQTYWYLFYLRNKVSWSHFSFNYHAISLFPFIAKCLKILSLPIRLFPFIISNTLHSNSSHHLPQTALTQVSNNLHVLNPTMYPESSFYLTHLQRLPRLSLPLPVNCLFSFWDTMCLWFSSFLLIRFFSICLAGSSSTFSDTLPLMWLRTQFLDLFSSPSTFTNRMKPCLESWL